MTDRIRTIKIFDQLGEQFDKVHHLAVGSVADAVKMQLRL